MSRGKGLARGKPLERGTKGLARGKGLDRGKPLERGSSLERGDSQLARGKGLAPRSKARTAHMKDERRPLVEGLVAAGVTCEISPIFDEYGIAHNCIHTIGGMHERRKSGQGGSRRRLANLVPACNLCNEQVENLTEKERELVGTALTISDGDPEWDLMGRKRDIELDNV